MSTALPPMKVVKLLYDQLNARNAYNVCLELEHKATTDEDRMHARILGYLILHAPSSAAQAEIVRAIHSCCTEEERLLELGHCFLLWFILPFKISRVQTPPSSYCPSCPLSDRLEEELKDQLKDNIIKMRGPPKDHVGAKVQALIRDGYKCAVTGLYDTVAYSDFLVDPQTLRDGVLHTQLVQISPESACFDVTRRSSSEMDYYAPLVSAVMQCFGYDRKMVNGSKVHSLYNVMTMAPHARDAFDRLQMWFENTNDVDRYRVQTVYPFCRIPREVSFTSTDPRNLPCPSQQLLALHATCAKVAHLSGARDYIDRFDDDIDVLNALETDGSSFGVLTALTHSIEESMGRQVASES